MSSSWRAPRWRCPVHWRPRRGGYRSRRRAGRCSGRPCCSSAPISTRATSRRRTSPPLTELRSRMSLNSSGVFSRLWAVIEAVKPCPAPPGAAELTCRDLAVLRLDGARHVTRGEAEIGEFGGIEPDAHRVLGAEDGHLPTPLTRELVLHRGDLGKSGDRCRPGCRPRRRSPPP